MEAIWSWLKDNLTSTDTWHNAFGNWITEAALFVALLAAAVWKRMKLRAWSRKALSWIHAADRTPRWVSVLGFPVWLLWKAFGRSQDDTPAHVAAQPSADELQPLGEEQLDVLYVASRQTDTDSISLTTIVEQTGMHALRVQVACGVLHRHSLLVPNGRNAQDDRVYALTERGTEEALKLHDTRAPASELAQELPPNTNAVFAWLGRHYEPTTMYWISTISEDLGLPVIVVEQACSVLRRRGYVRLSDGETWLTDSGRKSALKWVGTVRARWPQRKLMRLKSAT
jgi:hypothetical protein